ncbi:MAG: cytochrome c biogenesis protein CcsA [Kiritimatiellae bacterium]|nr:cytochrome c biogenesis protein CcsA [Kiritimatiellia bacterium]
MSKHLLHLGFLLAIGALVLKAAFMPPKMQVALAPGESAAIDGGVLVLKSFEVPKYPDGKPRQYISDVHVLSGMGDKTRNPEVRHAKISVNHPFRWNGWWFYQSSYDAQNESYTVLDAVRDPFLPIAALAGIFLVAGAGLMSGESFAKRKAGIGLNANPECSVAGKIFSALKFFCAAAIVLLVLFIAGKVLLVKELVPALQSPLLVPHVGSYIVSYAILIFAAFGIGRRFVPFGFFLMTAALVLGALWGKICWGDWWQYDPKEMWSLATWLTFAAYFHFRGNETVSKRLLRFGAIMIVLTLTWVNFSKFFKGLHSYV